MVRFACLFIASEMHTFIKVKELVRTLRYHPGPVAALELHLVRSAAVFA